MLRNSIEVPEQLAYRYVTATLDLSLPGGRENLLVSDAEGELVLRAGVPRPGG